MLSGDELPDRVACPSRESPDCPISQSAALLSPGIPARKACIQRPADSKNAQPGLYF